MFDALFMLLDEVWSRGTHAVAQVGWGTWLLATFPLLIFGDCLYYYVPSAIMALIVPFQRRREGIEEARHREFLRTRPRVSVVIAGRNEEQSIAPCIRSMLEQEYPNLEIIVVDDASTDRMYEIARTFAERGQIRLLRNNASLGRGGRASATNLGVRASSGEFILSVDADTTFDRDLVLHMIGPFYDPAVGVVAGNLKVRNLWASFVTRMQGIEYLVGIGLGKRWTDLRNVTLQASGALGAFRKRAVLAVGAWDNELAEDADVSLKLHKAGWRLRFAPRAIALTDAPDSWRNVGRQRYRWDRGTVRTYFHKHGKMMNPFHIRWNFALELAINYFFHTICTLTYPLYLILMVIFNPIALAFALIVSEAVCIAGSMLSALAAVSISERRRQEWPLVLWSFFIPFYKEYLRWVRLRATIHEIGRYRYEDSYLPDSAWRCAPRW